MPFVAISRAAQQLRGDAAGMHPSFSASSVCFAFCVLDDSNVIARERKNSICPNVGSLRFLLPHLPARRLKFEGTDNRFCCVYFLYLK